MSKTLKQQCGELGITHEISQSDVRKFSRHLFSYPGKRLIKTIIRDRIAKTLYLIAEIERYTGHIFTNKISWKHYGLPLEDLKRFSNLMQRLPTEVEVNQIILRNGFKWWFNSHYIKPKTIYEDVAFTGSDAYNLYYNL